MRASFWLPFGPLPASAGRDTPISACSGGNLRGARRRASPCVPPSNCVAAHIGDVACVVARLLECDQRGRRDRGFAPARTRIGLSFAAHDCFAGAWPRLRWPLDFKDTMENSIGRPYDARTTPPTAKEKNSVQRSVNSLLDTLAPERTTTRADRAPVPVEQHRTPTGCVLQAPTAALTVRWFADTSNDAALASSMSASGAAWCRDEDLRPRPTARPSFARCCSGRWIRPPTLPHGAHRTARPTT